MQPTVDAVQTWTPLSGESGVAELAEMISLA
jgi:hypothetical protein